MRTKYILGIMMSAVLLFSGCMKEDIDELRAQQAENAARIAALEQWQQTVNGNITSLQQLVTALEGNDYVTGVTAFDTPAPGGYRVTFSKSGEATIWNGAKGDTGETGATGATGAAGHSPAIGVKQFPDNSGAYYWTLDGEWITDDGDKMPVTGAKGDTGDPGTPGSDGATPKVAIGSDGYWYISADGTATGADPADAGSTGWTNTNVKATGDKGETGATGATGPKGDAIFADGGIDHTTSDDYVEFTLAGTPPQTKIRVPRYKDIAISYSQPGIFIPGQEYRVSYTGTGTAEPTDIRVTNVPDGWTVTVDKGTSEFVITPPADFGDPDVEFGKATIWLDNGNQIAAMYNLELSNRYVESNTQDAKYYQNGVEMGTVYLPNDGTPGSGLIIHNNYITSVKFDDPGSYATIDATNMTGQELFEEIKRIWPDQWQVFSPWADAAVLGLGWFVATVADLQQNPPLFVPPLLGVTHAPASYDFMMGYWRGYLQVQHSNDVPSYYELDWGTPYTFPALALMSAF